MEKHDLLHEFPEYQEKIHQLKMENHHFRKLFDEYYKVEHEVYRIKIGAENTPDEILNELKAELLFLKDEIFSILKN